MNRFFLAKFFFLFGIIFLVISLLIYLSPKLKLFTLPGDIIIKRENFVFYFPIMTSIILSIILTIIFFLISILRR
ncbi:MAG: DUF2905 domain-containing protein [candidate division WOR-3 bacterium]|nr:DUF2905 domain-containing protein [candidate division WOR-3 bacterium]